MANSIISQEVNIEMLEKLADGTFKIKYPKTKANLVIGLTKGHVGLGNVLNYGIATQSQAESGTVNTAYMTPLRVKQAIQKVAPKVVTGTYVGNDSTSRIINTGITPQYVIIYSYSDIIYEPQCGAYIHSNASWKRTEDGDLPNGRKETKIVTGGFQVSYYDNINDRDVTYCYMAIG